MNDFTKQLDNALATALAMPSETPMERYQRTVSLVNVKAFYRTQGNVWPALDAVQRKAFDECHLEALVLGLER